MKSLIEAGFKLKLIKRKGWVVRGIRDPESVAEHTFMVSLITMVMADEKGLDVAKALRMALLHDIVESVTDDLMPEEKLRMGKELKNIERKAVNDILSDIPKELAKVYKEAIDELNEGFTEEARLVKQVDGLEMILQAVKYSSLGKDLSEIIRSGLKKLMDNDIKEVAKRLMRDLLDINQ